MEEKNNYLLSDDEILELIADFLKNNDEILELKINKIIKKLTKDSKYKANKIKELYLNSSYKNSSVTRSISSNLNIPQDIDSSLELLQIEKSISYDFKKFIWKNEIKDLLNNIEKEHLKRTELSKYNLEPIKTILFYGEPGVGKTMSAKLIANKLKLPLLTLDLSSVMSSYLGKTGSNIKSVFDYAINNKCVLLLDEFDAIAKYRSDDKEVGELKRLVTVLLQSLDNWPSTSILIAATNHSELLDKAVWRRFDQVIEFNIPVKEEIRLIVNNYIDQFNCSDDIKNVLISSFNGLSHGIITKEINKILKDIIINDKNVSLAIFSNIINRLNKLTREDKLIIANHLYKNKILTQRKLSEKLSISRDAIRVYMKKVH